RHLWEPRRWCRAHRRERRRIARLETHSRPRRTDARADPGDRREPDHAGRRVELRPRRAKPDHSTNRIRARRTASGAGTMTQTTAHSAPSGEHDRVDILL